MKKTIFIGLLFFMCCLCTLSAHPIKMSYSKLYLSKDGEIELKIKVFRDDLEMHLGRLYRLQKIDFSCITAVGVRVFQKYIKDKLVVKQGAIESTFLIRQIKHSKDNLCYEFTLKSTLNINAEEAFEVRNSILFDAFNNQINNVRFNTDNITHSIRYAWRTYNEHIY